MGMNNFWEFAQQFKTQKYKKGKIILWQDEVPKAAFVIKTGLITTYNITAEGDERPISFDIKGGVFPTA